MKIGLLLLALPLLGCGGSSGASSNSVDPEPEIDRFVGSWSGAYTAQWAGGPGGSITMMIVREDGDAAKGIPPHVRVSGIAVDTRIGTAAVTGSFNLDPRTYDSLTLTFPERPGAPLNGSVLNFALIATVDARGHLILVDDPRFGGSPENPKRIDFELVRTSP